MTMDISKRLKRRVVFARFIHHLISWLLDGTCDYKRRAHYMGAIAPKSITPKTFNARAGSDDALGFSIIVGIKQYRNSAGPSGSRKAANIHPGIGQSPSHPI